MRTIKTYGTCPVCEGSECEIDDAGCLFCPACGSRETMLGEFIPQRKSDRDYHAFSRSFEACPLCGERMTTRDSDDLLFCLGCARTLVVPVPDSWYPQGAVCQLGFRCELPA